MEATPLLEKIAADAREAAAQTLAQARERAVEISANADAKAAAQRADTELRIARDAKDMETRMERMGELDDRKALLNQKRQVMDEAFTAALHQLHRLPPKRARAFFLERLPGTAQGGEGVMVGEQSQHVVDQGMVDEVNRQLQEKGKPGVTLLPQRVPGFGFVLQKGGVEFVCTFERLLDDLRAGAETEVANILFPTPAQ